MALLLFVGSQTATAQDEKRLFEELPADQIARIERYNWWQIRTSPFFASRYRVVAANTKLLFGDDGFVFNPFEDSLTTFVPVELERAEKLFLWFWKGIPAGSAAAGRDQAPEDINKSGPNLSIQSILDGNPKGFADFAINTYSVNRSNGRVALDGMESETPSPTHRADQSDSGQVGVSWERDAFRTVTGRVQFFKQPSIVYMIEPLRFSPRYHLVWEIDPQHWFGPWEEQNEAYTEYLESLPKEPRNRPMLSVIE